MCKEEFKDRLKLLRMNKGLTQSKFAKEIGKSELCIRKWEAGVRFPNSKAIISICEKFNVSADWLLGLTDGDVEKLVEKDLEYLKQLISEQGIDIKNIDWGEIHG